MFKYLKAEIYWPRMEEKVTLVVNSCEECSRGKNKCLRDKAPLTGTLTGEPFERIAIDITGPFRTTKQGKRYVLGIIDTFQNLVPWY